MADSPDGTEPAPDPDVSIDLISAVRALRARITEAAATDPRLVR